MTFSGSDTPLTTVPAEFAVLDYQPGNMARLRNSMKKALLEEGLWEDEAEAMLNTWKLSYFQSPGLRLFFTLPRVWTDEVLPLDVSEPAETVRAMIGRIEIVAPGQRMLLKQLAHSPISKTSWLSEELGKFPPKKRREMWRQLIEGKQSLDDFDLRVPNDYRTFLKLGRFRDALILDELARRPTEALKKFVKNYRLNFQASTTAGYSDPRPVRPVSSN